MLYVTLLGDEWSSSAGGLSTINRELAIHLSNHPAVKVSLLVPQGACNNEERSEADTYGISVVEAKRLVAFDRRDWLSFPPHEHLMDIVVGHGVKLGRQVQVIRDSSHFSKCTWVQVVHTAPEDLSRYKWYSADSDPISKGETKHESEVELCKLADLVVPVGPRLKEAYSSYLKRYKTDENILSFTPGLFCREFGDLVAKQDPNENGEFKVLLFGRGDDEDFELKGYDIAAEAFTDQRLKNKPYRLIFVGAPEGKQKKVRGKLLERGIAEAQLTVRKFIHSRDRVKDLLCEADLAIMPSKSEGFGLVALEALSAGLPILVGSRSGFAKALENVPHGRTCIVNSDHPAQWAMAIEDVRNRHGMRLQEIQKLRASYGEMYSWREQCEALVNRMWKMGHDASDIAKDGPVTEKQPVAKTHAHSASGFSGDQRQVDEDTKTEDGARFSEESSQVCHNPSVSGFTSDQETANTVKMSLTTRDLSSELEDDVDRMLRRHLEDYLKHNKTTKLSTANGLSGFFKYLENAYNFSLETAGLGSLVIEGQCPDLQSLEHLWNDYRAGVLNEAAERFLVTDEIKREINLETVKLKTIIEVDNYLVCKKALTEKSETKVWLLQEMKQMLLRIKIVPGRPILSEEDYLLHKKFLKNRSGRSIMAALTGILLDVSGSMSRSIGEGTDEEGGPWARSIFEVIGNFVKQDVPTDNHVFAIGFGANCGDEVFDIIGTIKNIEKQRERIDQPKITEIIDQPVTHKETVGVTVGSIFKVQEASDVLHGCFDEKDLSKERSRELLKSVEPYIYGEKPLYQSIEKATELFQTKASMFSSHKKLLFILSDGEPTDGPSTDHARIARMVSKLTTAGVTVVSCSITDCASINPKRLFSRVEPAWDRGAKFLFSMSSKLPMKSLPRTIFVERDWTIDDTSYETHLFLQVNHPKQLQSACKLAQDVYFFKDTLSDVLASVELDIFQIKQDEQAYKAEVQQTGDACHANACATILYLSMKRILGRTGGHPCFQELRNKCMTRFSDSASPLQDLEEMCRDYRLRCREVDLKDALEAVSSSRPVVASCWLTEHERDSLRKFFGDDRNRTGILTRKEIGLTARPPDSPTRGHSFVLTSFDSESLRLLNSWGEDWGDKGFFRVQNADVLGLTFIDVYWKEKDLTEEEQNYFVKHECADTRKLMTRLAGLTQAEYTCPLAECSKRSPVMEFTGFLSRAKCPKCGKEVSTQNAREGNILALSIYLNSLTR